MQRRRIIRVTKAVRKFVLKRRIEDTMGEDQVDFIIGKGTRDTTGYMRMLGGRMLEVNREMYVWFIDWVKAFNRIDWNILQQRS